MEKNCNGTSIRVFPKKINIGNIDISGNNNYNSYLRVVFTMQSLLAMDDDAIVQSRRWTLFTMIFCSQTPKQCLIESSFTNWGVIFGNNCY